MKNKKVLIICVSIHHGNTMKIAKAISDVLDAKIVGPEDCDLDTISHYDMIGFGSGVYDGKHHKSLFALIWKIHLQHHKKAFIFSTSTIPVKITDRPIKEALVKKWFDVIGAFQCKGFMNYSFIKYIFGWFNKWRPNDKDIENAKTFARQLVY